MPTINLGRRKKPILSVNKRLYQDVYQDHRWKQLRAAKWQDNPICEACDKVDKVTQTEEIHHRLPFIVSGVFYEDLAYDYDNLISLCIPCHKEAHKQLKYRN